MNTNKSLTEQKLKYYQSSGISNLTKKHYDIRLTKNYSYGLSKIVLLDHDLRLIFYAIPTFKDGKPVANKSGEKQHEHQYTIEVQFVKADKIMDFDDPEGMEKSGLKKAMQKIIDSCDLKFYSDDPSFYWQGFWENLDARDSAIYPFKGTKGKDTWEARHAMAGGLVDTKIRVTKHIAQILIDMDTYKDEVANRISRGVYEYD